MESGRVGGLAYRTRSQLTEGRLESRRMANPHARPQPSATGLDLRDQGLLEEVEVLEGQAGAEGYAVERVLGDVARDAGDLGQQLVGVAEEAAAAGHHHALVDDV